MARPSPSPLAGAVALGLLFFAGAATAEETQCQAPPELLASEAKLPRVAQHLKERKPVTIVAIGGSSTAGNAVPSPAQAYPARLEAALTKRYPGVPIRVLNKGAPHEDAQQVLARFPRDVVAENPDLAIWETGTIEAVRRMDVESFATTLDEGLALLYAQHIDAILVNMQYSHKTAAVIDFDPYLDTMRRVADLNDAYLFPRFEIMKFWSDNGIFDFETVPKADRPSLATKVYDCLARQLADAIAEALP